MQNLHLLTSGVLANDPMIEWAGNHMAASTVVKCFNVDWTVVTHSEDRARKIVDQAKDVPMDMNVLVDPSARSDRDSSTLLALKGIPEGEWVWTIPEGAMVDVHAGGEILKMTSSDDSPIAVEGGLCRGVDHLIFRRPQDSMMNGMKKSVELFASMRSKARSIPCADVYISRGAKSDMEKLCVMYWNMKFWQHKYTDFYTKLLIPFRDKKCNFLEIGTAFGGSLRTWRDYMEHGSIIGIDSYPESAIQEFGIHCIADDSTTESGKKSVIKLCEKGFDIIIDDGDHRPETQLKTLLNFWTSLKVGGSYVIEDVYGFDGLIPNIEEKFENAAIEMIDQRKLSGYGDSVLVHIMKV
jgi:cephalosporin hydroxylase